MSFQLKKRISGGENQRLDFKFEISDSKKIARSLVAFSNTDGGSLLLGVKDNGVIAGVRSAEEYYMVEAAAQMYCKPEVKFQLREYHIDGKNVLEVIVPKGSDLPYLALSKEDKWLAYIRVNDRNMLANNILLRVWNRIKSKQGVLIRYTDKEKVLLEFLEQNGKITFSKFRKLAAISGNVAEIVLINFLLLDIIEIEFTENQTFYRLKPENRKGSGHFYIGNKSSYPE